MQCRYCGGELDPKYPACPTCGTLLSKEDCLALTGKAKILEAEELAQKKRKNFIITTISIIVSIAILTVGGYQMLNRYINPEQPKMTFKSGYGIINGDEPVVFVEFGENEKLEYIHGVKLYAYDKSDDGAIGDALSSDYEYTKSVDGSFRTVFFDASEFDLKSDERYTYTIEMELSFVDNSKIYTYQKTVDFPSAITGDVSDTVFDHSMDDVDETTEADTTQPTTEPITEATTTPEETTEADVTFIYASYWFMAPYSNNDSYNISSVKFEKNGKCTFTNFYKEGSANWKLTNSNGTYEVKGETLYVTDSEGMVESYAINSQDSTLSGLEARKFNSTKNAEDFFGI